MKKPKEYHIDSFEKLVNVINSDNFQAIAEDLLLWLTYVVIFYEEARKSNPELKDKTNWEITKCNFIWIDDGKHDMKSVNIHNTETGEVSVIKFKSKGRKTKPVKR